LSKHSEKKTGKSTLIIIFRRKKVSEGRGVKLVKEEKTGDEEKKAGDPSKSLPVSLNI
jgi:hypothetical protein